MDFDLFDIEIVLKLTTMILKGNYTCSQITRGISPNTRAIFH